MELLLVRHALPIRGELVEGVADPELSEAGLRQAEHLAQYLSSEAIDAVYSGPLPRARQTAALLAETRRLAVTIDEGLSVVTVNETGHLRGSGLPMGLFPKG